MNIERDFLAFDCLVCWGIPLESSGRSIRAGNGGGIRTEYAITSDTGKPFSPSSMAGAKICSMLSLPLPKRSTASHQPAAAPGTVTACTLVSGIEPGAPSASPSECRMVSSVHLAPARPDPFMAEILRVLAS